MPYLLRVELPDVPGSLGAVATAIGEAGGDIDAIEIVEHRPDGTAVDDVLLEAAPGVMPDSIVSACNRLDGVRVLWVSRYGAGGTLFLDLEAVEALTEDPATALDKLVDLSPATFRSDWAARLALVGDGVKVVHSTSATPDIADGQTDWFPLGKAGRLEAPGEWDAVIAAAQVESERDIIVVGRRGGPEILDSEIARLQHLTALAVSIAGAR
ncbi:MAG: ACT domain-containing protein [Nocardioidaceae bacterium]|nr:MAG: ACT domain-containing protein [Nocardioidaceae bacterium]